jgi:hypothetical protein
MPDCLYRSVKVASDGHPESGRTARTLGVRPGIDIQVGDGGLVVGGEGGMSVAPNSPENLPAHRRPPEHGGTGKDPIWELDVADLGEELGYREDPLMPGAHGFVAPALPTTFDAFEAALSGTRRAWRLL